MKASVAVAKEVDAKKGVSPTKTDNSILRLRDEPEMQLGSLRSVIGNITRNGGTPSVESIATDLSGMHTAQRAPALLALQQTHGNRYVQRVVTGIQAKLVVGQPRGIYEQEVDRVAEPSRVWDGAIGDQMRTILRLPLTSSFLTCLQKEVANPMTQSWQRLSPTERWLLICQTVLIGAGALAEAMTNEATRQLDKYLGKIIRTSMRDIERLVSFTRYIF